MSTRPSARRARSPAITSASTAIVSSGPEGLLILPWRGKRACGVRGELNRRRVRVYHTTWTPQTAPTEPTGIVVLALVHQITRTTSTIRHDTDGTSPRFTSATYAVSSGVSFRCRRGVNSGCRLTPADGIARRPAEAEAARSAAGIEGCRAAPPLLAGPGRGADAAEAAKRPDRRGKRSVERPPLLPRRGRGLAEADRIPRRRRRQGA